MMRRITFKRPIFLCNTHKEIFFGRLRTLPAHNAVLGTDIDITLLLNEPVDKQTIKDLTNIFNHWGIDSSTLNHNCSNASNH
jgi:hypothetical protein